MNDEASAQEHGRPVPLAQRLRFLLDQRAEREGGHPHSTYTLAAALNEQERRAGRVPENKKAFVTAAFLGKLLRGEQDDPRMSVLIALSEYFECSIDDLAAPVRDQAEVLDRLRRAGLEDIGMRAVSLASLGPTGLRTLRTMLDAVERPEE
ncbi:hypothetical protein [Streptomyces mirabilis]|uniref:hypothetical protein n=1 Tax=Streptomyces mirabilis TaxID=68239 RepID=UPI0033DDA4C1